MMTMQQNKRRDMRQECKTMCMLREKQKNKTREIYRGPRLECERWLWRLELGDGVLFAPGGDPAGKIMSRFDRGGETDPDDL